MSEFNKLQYSWFVNDGDQAVIRADSAEEFLKITEEFAKIQGDALKYINTIKQAQVASGVFTGSNPKAKGGTKKAVDIPPPVLGESGVQECLHGPMMDASDKGWKKRWYCKERGKSKECWARD